MSCEIIITISSIVRHGKMFRVDLITSIISKSRQLWFTNGFTGRKRCIHQPSARSLASKETGVQARTHEWGHNKYFIGDVSYIWKTYGCLDQSLTLPNRAWWSLIAVNQPSSSGRALVRSIPTSMWTFHQLYTVNSPLWKSVVDWECFHWKYRLHHATSHMIAWVKASSCKQVASLCPHTATALGRAMSLNTNLGWIFSASEGFFQEEHTTIFNSHPPTLFFATGQTPLPIEAPHLLTLDDATVPWDGWTDHAASELV